MPTRKITIQSCAKLNLILKVLDTRPDGFHNIQSIFQSIDLEDQLSFTYDNGSSGISIQSSNPDLPIGKDNLIAKAYDEITKIKDTTKDIGIICEIKKNIPIGAGLGGGSSNCAATLVALNELLEIGLELKELKEIGEKIGSDVPFFISGGTCFVHGRGENVDMMSPITNGAFIIITPPVYVDTTEAYKLLDESRGSLENKDNGENDIEEMRNLLNQAVLTGEIASFFHNDFEKPIFEKYPVIRDLKNRLNNLGPIALMTGSGSAVFLYFTDLNSAFMALDHYTPLEGEIVSLTRPTGQAFKLYG